MSFFFGDVKTDELKIENGIELYGGYNNAYKVTLGVQSTMASEYNLKFPLYMGSTGQALLLNNTNGDLIFGTPSASLSSISAGSGESNLTTTSGNIYIAPDVGNILLNVPTGKYYSFDINNSEYLHMNSSLITANTALKVNDTANITGDTKIGGNLDASGATTFTNTLGVFGYVSLYNTINSSSTTTGSLVVSGGVGIASNVNIGGNLNVSDNTSLSGSLNVSGATILSNTLDITGATNLNDTTQTTTVGTGALIVDGGVSVAKNANIGGTLYTVGATTLANTLDVSGATNLNDTTQSTSTTTGALIVDGGVGIASNVNIGGNVNINDSLNISGDITTANTFTLTQGTITINSNQTLTLDLSERSDFIITFAGAYNVTLSLTNVNKQGQQGTIIVKTPSSGTGTLSWSTSVGWYFPSATAPTMSTGNNVYDTYSYLVVDSSSPHVLVMDATNFQPYT